MKSADYINVLQCSLVPFLEQQQQQQWTFQQDNASIHVSKETCEWFRRKNIKQLDWPACSPDLNPIENLWGILTRRIYGNNKQYDTVDELKTAILREWENINKDLLKKLVDSMPDRLFECIKANGSFVK